MEENIASIKPQQVWSHFSKLLQIPHPSGHEEQIAQYLYDFAQKRNLDATIDEAGNVIIHVNATLGREHSPKVILQSHMDMVPVKNDDVLHDFLKDPIDAYIDGEFVKARGTTLGADDCIGVATILALIDDKDLEHGPLTAIFTVEEETTMKGAFGLKKEYLEGDYLINLDSEENSLLYIGCAGSCDVKLNFKFDKVKVENCQGLSISLNKFEGGHSGADINLGHANAIGVLALILEDLSSDFDFFIQNFEGGIVRNAIPSKAQVILNVPSDKALAFKEAANNAYKRIISTYERKETHAAIKISECEVSESLCYAQSLDLINLLLSLPHGVVRMSDIDTSIVETSVNLGTVKTLDEDIEICLMPRSLKETGLDEIITKIEACAQLLDNVDIELENRHACWLSQDKNSLIDSMQSSCAQLGLKPLKVTLMHAGLETASFAKTAPKLQLVSLGATILNPHSPKERVHIAGVGDVYEIVRHTLAQL